MKKCKVCKKQFTPQYTSIQPCCSIFCTLTYNKEKERIKAEKEDKELISKLKKELKTRGEYEEELESVTREIVRTLDSHVPCIACGVKTGKFSSGHYHAKGKNVTLRFNLDNQHKECFRCNSELSANIIGYNAGLREWYGPAYQEYVEIELPKKYPYIGWSIPQLILWKAEAKAMLKEIKQLEQPLSADDRLFWREHYNNKLGIYR